MSEEEKVRRRAERRKAKKQVSTQILRRLKDAMNAGQVFVFSDVPNTACFSAVGIERSRSRLSEMRALNR